MLDSYMQILKKSKNLSYILGFVRGEVLHRLVQGEVLHRLVRGEVLHRLVRGKADGGALFIVTTCMSIICLGLAFVGGDIPSKFPKTNPHGASIGDAVSVPAKDSLQLLTFKAKPPKLIPTIDPNAPPLSTNRAPATAPTAAQAPAGGAVASGGYTPPSTDDCGGKYAKDLAKLPGGKNYGDPNCTFTKDALYTLLKEQDPTHADLWYLTIAPGESAYNPNARAAPTGAQLALDAGGAWGLFQMGSSTPPGEAPPAPGKNGELDRGDVNWEMQAANAIAYNRSQSCSFRYWATAKAVWGTLSC
jgi:hypothetical protein